MKYFTNYLKDHVFSENLPFKVNFMHFINQTQQYESIFLKRRLL
jgi:hypothetical protein